MHDILLNMCHNSVTLDLKNLLVTLVLGTPSRTWSHMTIHGVGALKKIEPKFGKKLEH